MDQYESSLGISSGPIMSLLWNLLWILVARVGFQHNHSLVAHGVVVMNLRLLESFIGIHNSNMHYKKRAHYRWCIIDGLEADGNNEITNGQADGSPSIMG